MLFVLADIEVADGGAGPVASGGTRALLWQWDVDAGQLAPLSFSYRVPSSNQKKEGSE